MSMKHPSILAVLLVLTSGCTNASVEPEASVTPTKTTSQPSEQKERYDEVRARLLAEGWEPVPAKCSTQNLCGEHVELSTNMETVVSCGVFKKENKTATVCGESIPDALLVIDIKIEPAD
jgi:hypothetical protein